MIVARRLLRDRRRSTAWWCAGIVALVALVVLLYPSIEGQTGLEKMFDEMPAPVKAMIGSKGLSIISPQGYLHGRVFAIFVPLLLTIFGIGLGARAIGGAETDGELELLLANPITRARIVAERGAVLVGLMVALAAVAAVAVLVFNAVVGGGLADIPVRRVAAATTGALCISLLHASVAFSAGCMTGRRAAGVTAGTLVAIGGYLIQVLTASVDSLAWLGSASPWRWYLDRVILIDELTLRATLVPLAVSAAVIAVGTRVFLRRDLR